MMTGEFRCIFHARDYDSTVAFYRDGLDGAYRRGMGPWAG